METELVLSEHGLKDRTAWEVAGYSLPQYDRSAMKEATHDAPVWLHFGAGNIFKAFQANAAQKLLNNGIISTGIIAVERSAPKYPSDYTVLVTLKSDGTIEKTIIGSIAETVLLSDAERLREIFASESLQMVSFTITEKGYALTDGKGELFPPVFEDMRRTPCDAQSYMGRIAFLLYERFKAGEFPVAMVSMDNCSKNGDKLFASVNAFAESWRKLGYVPDEFIGYIGDHEKVSFPWTMIDKITPRPDASIAEILLKDGLGGMKVTVNANGGYSAPFVNAEESEYLVIEDNFPNGRPPLEKAGIYFTDRETVNRVERMKVCTCLNPLHTALAVFGVLLGYQRISDEMNDPELSRLVRFVSYKEGLPVVVNPGIISPEEFLNTVLNVRLTENRRKAPSFSYGDIRRNLV